MTWKQDYESKFISADEAAQKIKTGDYVAFTGGRESFAIGLAVAARKEELKNVRIYSPTPTYDFGWYDEGWQDSFALTISMPTATCQEAVDHRRLDFNPGTLIPLLVTEDSEIPDILLTEVSPPDDNGFCSFGNSLWDKKSQIKRAKLTVAEVNPNLIRTYGDNFIHYSEINYFVEHLPTGGAPGTGTLAGRVVKKPEPWLKNVAGYVNSIIRDGDTIQIGVGRTTEPLVGLGMFDGKKDLGFHSEATPPGVISLVKSGIINGKLKTLNSGKVVVTSIGGSTKEEMEWVHMNPIFHLVDVQYLEDPRIIATHDNFVAINNALAVDITGQIGAESLGIRIMSAAGGQIPFVFGAGLSRGGRSVTVLPSTAQDGKVSRIMSVLPEGTSVTIQRNLADYVVTEFGIARLKGKSFRQRAEALIKIAHPDFRPVLEQAASKRFWPS